jgi:hypothetical protein
MQSVPQTEHHWLQKLVGEWTYESECSMGPDQPAMKMGGKEVVRTLGGLWTVGEGNNEHGTSIMTLGYDEKQKAFVGTFIASMMSFLWVYRDGQLDETGKILTLNAEGPAFVPDAKGLVQYQDIIEIVDENNRILSSRMLLPDGNWQHFMSAHYKRVA